MKEVKKTVQETEEYKRLMSDKPWKKWGPYLAERQWGTVREDYSSNGDAWNYLTHDLARKTAYRWGEDGIGGISDDKQFICMAPAFWNGKDPILKERLFGLGNSEGNHGEDVKELYYYLDSTPLHTYMRMVYCYPIDEFPYALLAEENRKRSIHEPEYEVEHTGVFDKERYFEITVEYAKEGPEDISQIITVLNRSDEEAEIHVIPQVWLRNTWSWNDDRCNGTIFTEETGSLVISHSVEGLWHLTFSEGGEALFCENETRREGKGCFKDGIHEYLIHGNGAAVEKEGSGTKCGLLYHMNLKAGEEKSLFLRLSREAGSVSEIPSVLSQRKQEADEYFSALQKDIEDPELRLIQRRALAGILWNKQFYYFDIPQWLEGDVLHPKPPGERKYIRNTEWTHLNNADVILMPDTWEYPWYATWDLAFHCVSIAHMDPAFAREQLLLFCREWYMHPNGQMPAYEWNFSDVNPPVHAWAVWKVYKIDKELNGGKGDYCFLEKVFHKLLLNFTWWVNRKDFQGHNVFQGGFLGLDNIGVFDRSKPLPTGGYINQADGTSWMAMYCLNMMVIALELSLNNHNYEDIATKFFEHFLNIAKAMTDIGGRGIGLWDEEDGFYYDELNLPGGHYHHLKVRSLVGLLPLVAVETLTPELLDKVPEFQRRMDWFLNYRKDLASLVSRWELEGEGHLHLLSLLRGHRMKCLIRKILDDDEFLSDFGIRSLSKYHKDNPYSYYIDGDCCLDVAYEPGETTTWMFGGNSNWRGPVWFPLNYLIVESIMKFHQYYGDDFIIEYPKDSGQYITISEVAEIIRRRLIALFQKNSEGKRPCEGEGRINVRDDYILFYEYFHGDTGKGLGACHQGWTSLVANLIFKDML